MPNGLTQTAVGGFQQGQQLAQQGVRRNALAQIAGGIQSGNLELAGQQAAQIGDVDLVMQIRGLAQAGEEQALAKAKQSAIDLQDIVARFDSIPPDQLPQAVQAALPVLTQMFPDISPQQLMQQASDPNARRAAVAQAQDLSALIDQEQFAAKQGVEQQKLQLSREKLSETQRANLEREDIQRQTRQAKAAEKEAKATSAEQKQRVRSQGVIDDLVSTKGTIGRLRGHPGFKTAVGVSPFKTPFITIPGSKRADFEAVVETVKARLGFAELARMRAASPTGGALGQISERELSFLQAANQSLDTSQSERQFLENIKIIEESLDRLMAAQREAMQAGAAQDSEASGLSDEELQRIIGGG